MDDLATLITNALSILIGKAHDTYDEKLCAHHLEQARLLCGYGGQLSPEQLTPLFQHVETAISELLSVTSPDSFSELETETYFVLDALKDLLAEAPTAPNKTLRDVITDLLNANQHQVVKTFYDINRDKLSAPQRDELTGTIYEWAQTTDVFVIGTRENIRLLQGFSEGKAQTVLDLLFFISEVDKYRRIYKSRFQALAKALFTQSRQKLDFILGLCELSVPLSFAVFVCNKTKIRDSSKVTLADTLLERAIAIASLHKTLDGYMATDDTKPSEFAHAKEYVEYALTVTITCSGKAAAILAVLDAVMPRSMHVTEDTIGTMTACFRSPIATQKEQPPAGINFEYEEKTKLYKR